MKKKIHRTFKLLQFIRYCHSNPPFAFCHVCISITKNPRSVNIEQGYLSYGSGLL